MTPLSRLLVRFVERFELKRSEATHAISSEQHPNVSEALPVEAAVKRSTPGTLPTSLRRGCFKLKPRDTWSTACEAICPASLHHHHTEMCLLYDVWPYTSARQRREVARTFKERILTERELSQLFYGIETVEVDPPAGKNTSPGVALPKKRVPVAIASPLQVPWELIDPDLALLGCPKVSFSAEIDARMALRSWLKEQDDPTAFYYHCLNTEDARGCGRWHLGHRERHRDDNRRFREMSA